MKNLLWLDDLRDPKGNVWNNWIARNGVNPSLYNIVWVKNYGEFEAWISENGLPGVVCFDHDLGQDIAIERYKIMSKTQAKKLKKLETKSGFEAAKWMVNYCIDNNLELPTWLIQSANPVGAENIRSYLKSFEKSHRMGRT